MLVQAACIYTCLYTCIYFTPVGTHICAQALILEKLTEAKQSKWIDAETCLVVIRLFLHTYISLMACWV